MSTARPDVASTEGHSLRVLRSDQTVAARSSDTKPQVPQTAKTVSYDLSDNSEIMRSIMAPPTNCGPRAHGRSDIAAKLWHPDEATIMGVQVCRIGHKRAMQGAGHPRDIRRAEQVIETAPLQPCATALAGPGMSFMNSIRAGRVLPRGHPRHRRHAS